MSTLVSKASAPISRSEQSAFKQLLLKDFAQMTLCFLGAVYAVYYAPAVVNYLYFLVLVVLFFRSQKDYFWFAFFFILVNTPAFLFFETSAQAAHRLPLYRLAGGISFSVFDIFVLASLAKVFYLKKEKAFQLSRPLRFLLIYFALVSLPITFIIGLEDSSFFNTFRPYFYYAILLTFYFLIDDIEALYKFGYLLVPYVIFTLFDQLFLLTQGKLLIAIINPETVRAIVDNTITGGVRAYFSGFLLVFYVFLFALQLRSNKKYELFSGFAYLIIFLCLAAFIISATRIYLIIPMVVLIMYFIFSKQGVTDLIKLSLVTAVLVIVFFSLNLITFEFFLKSIWPRFESFFMVILGGGDLAKFDTVQSRLQQDLPSIMKGVSYSPIIGTGFSGIFRTYENNDLGFINTILIFGVVGFTFLINFIIMLFNQLQQWIKTPFTNATVVLNTLRVALFGILIGYATTYDFFTVRQIDRIYFISILLASGEIAVQHIKNQFQFYNHQPSKP